MSTSTMTWARRKAPWRWHLVDPTRPHRTVCGIQVETLPEVADTDPGGSQCGHCRWMAADLQEAS